MKITQDTGGVNDASHDPRLTAIGPRLALPESRGLRQGERHRGSEATFPDSASERFSLPGALNFGREVFEHLRQRAIEFGGKPCRIARRTAAAKLRRGPIGHG